MLMEQFHCSLWQHRPPVPLSLRVANHNLSSREIEILHAQRQSLQQPQSRSVQQQRDQVRHTRDVLQHRPYLVDGQDHRNAQGTLRTHQIIEPWQWIVENHAVEKEQRAQGLILRCRTYPALHREVGQELIDLRTTHRRRVPLSMKDNKAPYPQDVCLLGPRTEMTNTRGGTHAIEKLRLLIHRPRLPRK